MILLKDIPSIEKMRVAGRVAADTLTHLKSYIQPGITTHQLNTLAENFIRASGCLPAFLHYKDFPYATCISVNEQVAHCFPSDLALKDGDIVKIDLGAIYQGFYSDTARTYIVGTGSPEVIAFLTACYQAMWAGIKVVRDGGKVSDISRAVAGLLDPTPYGIVRDLVGHGIGENLHEDPQVSNFVSSDHDAELTVGMALAIEPIITLTKETKIVTAANRWDIVTKSGLLSCHFEHSLALTPDGVVVLTKREEEGED